MTRAGQGRTGNIEFFITVIHHYNIFSLSVTVPCLMYSHCPSPAGVPQEQCGGCRAPDQPASGAQQVCGGHASLPRMVETIPRLSLILRQDVLVRDASQDSRDLD